MNITSIASRPLVRAAIVVAAAVLGWLLTPLAIAQAQSSPPLVAAGPVQAGGGIALAFDGSKPQVIGLAARRLRFACDDGSVDRLSLSALSPSDPEAVVNGRFRARLSLDADDMVTGGRLVVRGVITSTGVRGTVAGVEWSREHGTCRTGLLRFSARPRA